MTETESSLRHHVVTFFTGGVLTATRLVTGFARVKYLALALGTAGVGFLSQAAQTQLLLVSLGSLAMARGMITRMGMFAAAKDSAAENRLLSTALTVQLTTSILLIAIAQLGSTFIVESFFPGEAATAQRYLPLVLLSVPLSVVATSYGEGILYGAQRFDLYVKASMVTAVLGAAATMFAVWMWGLAGGVAGILATSLIHCISTLSFALKVRPLSQLFRFGFHGPEAAALIKYSFVMLAIAATSYLSRLWIQSHVIGALGVQANGLLHVPLAMTSYYTPLLSNPLWGRLHPSVSRTGDTAEGRRELSVALTFTAALTTLGVVSILALEDILVQLAYSREFLPATDLLPAQLLGDYFYFIALTFGVYTLGVGYLRTYLGVWVGYYAASALVATTLIPILGLQAVAVGYGIAGTAIALGSLVWFSLRRPGPEGRTALLVVAACAVVATVQSALAFWNVYRPVQFAIVVVMGVICLVYFVIRRGGWRLG